MSDLIGKKISHYSIVEQIGQGGMGVVYKARDAKLDRFVALKFLPPQLGQEEQEKQRFIREAKAASALDHPNICTIYEINETEDGQMYIAMAHYGGEPLKKKIERGSLSVTEAIDIAGQVALGLSRVHEEGIIHRDIKPANILITKRGEVKIVDFGLARLAGRTQMTKTGTTMGTVAYISPEQLQGESVDWRTDIWSLGVVFYEMLTGRLPFEGEFEQAVAYSILTRNPEPVAVLRSDAPVALEQAVEKLLRKDAGERYQHVDELLVDLRPLHRELRNVLVLQREVALAIARQVAVTLTPQEETRLTAAREVDIEAYKRYVLGLQARNKDDWDRAREYFEQAIAIDSSFAPAYAAQAIEYALEGGFNYLLGGEIKAMQLAEKALSLDPSLSEPYIAIGLVRELVDWDWGGAEEAFRRAIALNPGDAFAHFELGYIRIRLGRFEEALAMLKQALYLDPLSARYQMGVGDVYLNSGRYDQAIAVFNKAHVLDPSASTGSYLAMAYWQKGIYAEACRLWESFGWTKEVALARHYTVMCQRENALAVLEDWKARWERGDAELFILWDIAAIYADFGEKDQALDWLEKAYQARLGLLVYVKVDPGFYPLHGEPRFQALLEKMGFPE